MNIDNETRPGAGRQAITFATRSGCVNCGAARLTPLWQGTFGDELTGSFLRRFHYSGNALDALHDQAFSLVRCADCGMAFHQRILAPEWVNALYSEWIDDSQIDAFRAQNVDGNQVQARFEDARQMVKHVLRLQKLVGENAAARLRLLDYGCGDGKFLQFAALFGFEAYGIDFSATRVRRAGQAGLTIVGGLEEFDAAAPGKLHAVTLFQVLEHLVEPVQMLRQLADRLVEGGVLVVEVPDCRGITRPTNFEQFHAVHPLEHINAFTPLTLKQMCERLGFVSIPRHAAHVTTSVIDLLKTEISRVVQPSRTAQYFRKL